MPLRLHEISYQPERVLWRRLETSPQLQNSTGQTTLLELHEDSRYSEPWLWDRMYSPKLSSAAFNSCSVKLLRNNSCRSPQTPRQARLKNSPRSLRLPLQALVAFAVIAAALLDPFKAAVSAIRFIDSVLIEASVEARLAC